MVDEKIGIALEEEEGPVVPQGPTPYLLKFHAACVAMAEDRGKRIKKGLDGAGATRTANRSTAPQSAGALCGGGGDG